ncbi:biotin transporter BioY [Skermanella stibiiresistens]|uniref:biotin transporter BioY n=1 Tax=Skermanella stibiiresistens TaxID=913326 RepID=UPI0004AEA769|nr:biotin transporter BioY [Skermanella stibiiresistens]
MVVKHVVHIALFAAIVAALGLMPPIPLPVIPVPITAQSMGAMLAGSILGARRGGLALVVFIALVMIGMPILSGGRGGFGVFMGPTAGFILSWAVAAFMIGHLTERSWSRLTLARLIAFNVLGGIVVVYGIGIAWLSLVSGVPIDKALYGSAVFIPGDIVKCVLASMIAMTVKRSYPVIRR